MPPRPTGSAAARLRRACTEVATLQQKLETSKHERDLLIREMSQQGQSYAEISELCGLSRARVAQIVTTAA